MHYLTSVDLLTWRISAILEIFKFTSLLLCHSSFKAFATLLILSFLDSKRISCHPLDLSGYHTLRPRNATAMSSSNSGVSGAAKFVSSTVTHTVAGVGDTIGGIVGAGARGVGETIEGATGGVGKPVANGIVAVGTGVEGGTKRVGEGLRAAGEGKKW